MIQPVFKPVVKPVLQLVVKPGLTTVLNDTAGCQTGSTSALTTSCIV